MIHLTCEGDSSEGNLAAFRLLKPIAGKFKTFSATKQANATSSEARMEFENLIISFYNLNIGYDGMGPGCLVQMLAEVGMNKDALTKAVEKAKAEFVVEGNEVTTIR